MVCLGSAWAGGKSGEGESEEVKWASLMMTRLDVARQTVSSCLAHTFWKLHKCTHSYVAAHTRSPPSSLLGNYLLFRVLSYKSNWSYWPPANPWGCAGNPIPHVYTEETAQASEQHAPVHPPRTSTHTSSWFVVSQEGPLLGVCRRLVVGDMRRPAHCRARLGSFHRT